MKGQIDLFNFIEKLEEQQTETIQKTPNQLLYIIDNPITRCANCVCNYCVNNVEEMWRTVRPEELREVCFNCDECHEYSGNRKDTLRRLRHCERFVISDYGAERNRKKLKIMQDETERRH